ncbi:MAG: sulfatase-like hydrolase/transferase [Geminicoccaceae bacterium]
MGKRPNIILVTTDQHRGDCFGFEGRKVKTPHLDAFARRGTRFAHCTTANPICQPSRASILTGLYPLTHGVRDNGIDLPVETGDNGWAGRLATDGYATAFLGKAHFSTVRTFAPTGRPECQFSARDFDTASWFGPYMGFDHVELMLMGHFNLLPKPPPDVLHYEDWFFADGQGEAKLRAYAERLPPESGFNQSWHSALPPLWHTSTWCGDRAVEFIKRDHDEPFALWVSIPDPHTPFDAPEPWSRMHDPAAVDLPPHRTRDFSGRPWWHEASRVNEPVIANDEYRSIRANWSRPGQLPDEVLAEVIANYYGMISLADHTFGRIVQAVREAGIEDETYVIFTSDHGDWLGDHGLLLKGPMHYDGLIRVGMLIAGPGIPQGAVVDQPVSLIDLHPTLMDIAGVDDDRPRHGQSLMPVIAGEETRSHTYLEWHLAASRCGVELQLRTVRTPTRKLTVDLISEAGELYDLANDPYETCNRWDDPAYRDDRRELMAHVAARPADELAEPLPVVGMA